jgi:hypothetical protein
MNTSAMTLPVEDLVGELETRAARCAALRAAREAAAGARAVRISSYMENIGWPELFGYEMHRVHDEPAFAASQRLRELIFWCDNVEDDTVPEATMQADVGWYWDITLFGMRIHHTAIGVPEFEPHPFSRGFDPSTLGHFDFFTTGDMPRLIRMYESLREISVKEHGGRLAVSFPTFNRGPLDIYIQLRGFEGFVDDCAERPEELRAVLNFLVDERLRFAEERRRYLGEKSLPSTSFVADDWVNIPFLSPTIFRDFVLPLYRRLRAEEAPVTNFHTCGNMEPVARELLEAFPDITLLDVSPWNSVAALDAILPPRVGFLACILNTVTLGGSEEEQRSKLAPIRDARARRKMQVMLQAIVRLPGTYEETFRRLNACIALARAVVAG